MSFLRRLISPVITMVLFIVNLLVIQYTDFDFFIQDKVYNFQTHKWPLEDIHARYGWLLYKGIKDVLACFALILLVLFVLSFTKTGAGLKKYRREFLCIVLSLAICPLIASEAKQVTNIYCPYQIERYGGDQPYVKPFSKYPPDFVQKKKALGFPAGHAAGGFALFSLFFVFKKRKYQLLFGGLGLTIGIFMGTYQILRGQHYVGDTLVTVFGCLLINMVIFRLLPVSPAPGPEE
jgi:membrane-associated PAP2 superfamily phosphatase